MSKDFWNRTDAHVVRASASMLGLGAPPTNAEANAPTRDGVGQIRMLMGFMSCSPQGFPRPPIVLITNERVSSAH